ncbi:MAG: aspartate kinase [Bacteroidetes bacterium]|nr:aspartate kinase [Bacteroidota bacterium]
MITIAAAVEKVVHDMPLLEECLAEGIVNLSAVARAIRPRVESTIMKKAGNAALVMALRRLAPRLKRKAADPRGILRLIRDITVRSNITEFTFRNSDTILQCQVRLLQKLRGQGENFITCTQGVHEMTVMVHADFEGIVEKVFHGEKRVSRVKNLAALGIHLTPKVVEVPGVYYAILKQLTWAGINVVEVVSTMTELTLMLEKKNVERAFLVLKQQLWP